jgi:signal transduction histidine kinase
MTGILLSKRFIFITSLAVGSMLIITAYLQATNRIVANRYWTSQTWSIAETSAAVIIFLVIAIITWLSNREIERSIFKLRKSEAELKEERDSLEVKVEQRTTELKEVQAEKMAQLYRFAEFGRISSGLFHDLINPLNAVSLNLGKVDDTGNTANNTSIQETKQYLSNAVHAAKKLEDLVLAVRKQLAREETRTLFIIDEEVRHVIDVLSHKARKANVELRFVPCEAAVAVDGNIKIFGDAIKFNQVVLNLVANGIDACIEVISKTPSSRWVQVSLTEEPEAIVMLVEDNGIGILDHHMDKIFEPFFTTKANGQGIGIGLSMAKRIVEKDFGGLLTAKSNSGSGALFRATFPLGKQVHEYATK